MVFCHRILMGMYELQLVNTMQWRSIYHGVHCYLHRFIIYWIDNNFMNVLFFSAVVGLSRRNDWDFFISLLRANFISVLWSFKRTYLNKEKILFQYKIDCSLCDHKIGKYVKWAHNFKYPHYMNYNIHPEWTTRTEYRC